MTDWTVRINSQSYKLARQGKNPAGDDGPRAWSITARPSIPTDPSLSTAEIEWQVWGPNLNSFELIPTGQTTGYLGIDYGIDTESRNDGENRLGPAISTTDLSGTGGTAANTNCAELSRSMNATEFLYVGRGTRVSKVLPSTMARVAESAGTTLGANVKDLLYTRAAGGTQEISVALGDATAYQVITAVAAAASDDTYSANNESAMFSKFISSGLGANNRIFGAQGTTSSTAARVQGNILTGSVTMDASAWAVVGTLAGDNLTITGLGLDGNFLAIGTNGGIYMVDPQYSSFRPLDPETETDSNNGTAMGNWLPLGLVFNNVRSCRFVRSGAGASIGPEVYTANTSPVRGRVTGIAGTDRWLYFAIYDDISDDTYLVACRPRLPGDPHSNLLSYFTLHKFTDTNVDFLKYFGTFNAARTLPTLVGGHDTDIFYMGCGRTPRWSDDSSYTYNLTGTTYLTEARRYPGLIKDVEAVEFEAGGTMDAGKTITIGVSFDGAAAVTLSAVTSTGYKRLLPVSAGVPLGATTWSGRRLKPQIAYATDAAASSPAVIGKLRVLYRGRPIQTQVVNFSIILPSEFRGQSSEEATASLMTAWGSGPVAVEDWRGDTLYYRIDSVSVSILTDTGDDRNRGAGAIMIANVHATRWPVSSGE